MRLFVVQSGTYDENKLHGVFDSREQADQAVEQIRQKLDPEWWYQYVTEVELNVLEPKGYDE